MKSSSLSPQTFRSSFLALVAIALPCTANATLLVGWHDFDAASNTNESSEAGSTAVGFSGTLIKNENSQGAGGDVGDGSGLFYGNSNISSGSGNDGAVRVPFAGSGTIFSLTNSSGGAISLSNLFFDATKSTAASVLNVAWRYGTSGAFTSLLSTSSLNPTGDTSNVTNLTANFSDLAISLVGIALGNSQTIQFRFNVSASGQGARLDNIAITGISAIPEPASLLALGCVLGSGLMLRNRRIKPIQA